MKNQAMHQRRMQGRKLLRNHAAHAVAQQNIAFGANMVDQDFESACQREVAARRQRQ